MTSAHLSDAPASSPLPFQMRPLSPALGAELIGLDLSAPMSAALFESVRDAWHRHLVILLRDQHLSEDEQVRFAERFGPISMSTRGHYQSKNPAIMLISNIREDGKQIGALPDGEMHFHTDQCHQERPAMATMLYSIEVPSVGGNTLFANAYAAYETRCLLRSSKRSTAARRSTLTTTTRPPPRAATKCARACRPIGIRSCGRIRQRGAKRCSSTA
jgi:alpha-ketoglutarate-dependent taurine dioxygenase